MKYIMRSRGDVKRDYLTHNQLKTLSLKKRRLDAEGKQIPIGVNGWVHSGFSDLTKEDAVYRAKKAIGDYMTELFFKTMFTKDDIFFLYIVLNATYKEIVGIDKYNILIKGGAVLSIFREKIYETFKKNENSIKDEEVKTLCHEFIEDTKPKIADLDVIVPYPDAWSTDNEKILNLGYKVYKKFKEKWDMEDMAVKFTQNESVIDILKIQLSNSEDEVRKHILTAMKLPSDSKVDFELVTNKGFSTYTRQLEDFFSESYKNENDGDSLVSCGLVEGIVMPTSKIEPLVFDLCRIILNFKIKCTEKDKEINIKLSLVDMPFQAYSNIKKSNSFDVQVELTDNKLNELKKRLYADKLLDGKVHTITIDQAVNEDIRDMLYRRNYFVFEDTKYEKRLRRDILYNALLLFVKVGVKRTRRELKEFKDSLMFINTCLEQKGEDKWLACLFNETDAAKTKLPSRLYHHILDSIKSMSGILLNNLPSYLKNNASLVEEYKEELRQFLDRVIIDTDYTLKLFTKCFKLFE